MFLEGTLKMPRLCFHNSKPVGHPNLRLVTPLCASLAHHMFCQRPRDYLSAPCNPASCAPNLGRGLGLGSGRRNPLCRSGVLWKIFSRVQHHLTIFSDGSISHVLCIYLVFCTTVQRDPFSADVHTAGRLSNWLNALPSGTRLLIGGGCFKKKRCISKATPLHRGGFVEDYTMGDPGCLTGKVLQTLRQAPSDRLDRLLTSRLGQHSY
jgi:hypothetical protein